VPNADVEDVAFGICQGRPSRPVLVELSDLGGAESDRALDFGREVSRDKVKVQPILALARFGYTQEHQRGKGAVFRGWDQCEELVGAVVDRAVEQGRPEGGDLVSASGIDDNLAKSDSHGGVPLSTGKLSLPKCTCSVANISQTLRWFRRQHRGRLRAAARSYAMDESFPRQKLERFF
jgi:hypothetical protein